MSCSYTVIRLHRVALQDSDIVAVCWPCLKHQSLMWGFGSPHRRIAEGSCWFGILLEQVESANHTRDLWLRKDPDVRASALALTSPLLSLICIL